MAEKKKKSKVVRKELKRYLEKAKIDSVFYLTEEKKLNGDFYFSYLELKNSEKNLTLFRDIKGNLNFRILVEPDYLAYIGITELKIILAYLIYSKYNLFFSRPEYNINTLIIKEGNLSLTEIIGTINIKSFEEGIKDFVNSLL